MKKPRTRIRCSVSLDSELAAWLEDQATAEKRSASHLVNALLRRLRTQAARSARAAAGRRVAPAREP